MNKTIINRVKEEAEYILNTKATIRETAKFFKISKSTVHKDLQERLKLISPEINKAVHKLLEEHMQERHIKGGLATKEKYKKKEE